MEISSKRELVDFFTEFVFRSYPEWNDSIQNQDKAKIDWSKKIMKRKDIQEVILDAMSKVRTK